MNRDALLQWALNAVGIGVWRFDFGTQLLYWTSPRTGGVTHDSTQTLKLEDFMLLVHPDDRAAVRQSFHDAVAARSLWQIEYRVVWDDGSIHWLEARGEITYDAEGEPTRMAGVTIDITERKYIEEALRAGEEHLGLAIEAADIGTWDNPIIDGEIQVGWSPRCKAMFGIAPDVEVTSELRLSLIHPQDREHFTREIEQSIDPAGDGEYDSDYRAILPDGSQHWFISKGRCIFEGEGKDRRPVRLVGIVIDVTERRQVETERRRRQESDRFLNQVGAVLAASLDYDKTLQRIAALCVPWLADWAFIDVITEEGQARRIEVAQADPARVELAEALKNAPPAPDQLDTPMAQALLQGRSLLMPDVSEAMEHALSADTVPPRASLLAEVIGGRPASFMSVPLVARGKTLGALSLLSIELGRRYGRRHLAIAEDLARRAALAMDNARLYRQAEQSNALLREQAGALIETDRRKNEFLAVLAHELRNPLAPLSANLHVLRLAGAGSPAAKQAQAVMERQVGHLVRLIDDLLDISRVSRGIIELRKSPIKLADIIDHAVEISRPMIEERYHELSVTLPSYPAWLDADADRLTQVFVNLLNNASKFTPHSGKLAVAATAADGVATISVRDNGIGIGRDELAHVFDLFTQGQHELQSGAGGLGIGLTLVRQLVEMHDGTVEAKSEGADRGAEFVVRLPLVEAPTETAATAPRGPAAGKPSHRRVLVVDDNQDITDSLSMLIEMMGHEVQATCSGEDSLRLGEEFEPDIVFLDIGMPGMSGHDVAREIRLRPWGASVQLVALTGWGQQEDRQRSREAGFDLHLVKPIDADMLEKLLAEADALAGN
ncbi:MAG TPA: PAS domain-containing protein [Gammaproteobacteria bacterium]|nr:PAS domain-containing protein [Gammaproteobacteria bacterium]